MQRKLSEIAEIPVLLQSTLQSVSRTFDKFISSEPKSMYYQSQLNEDIEQEFDTSPEDICDEEILSEVDSIELDKNRDESSEIDYDSEEDEEEIIFSYHEIPELTVVQSETESITPELTEEDLLKKEKQQKMQILEQSWPWADRQRKIYKQSTCHLVPRLSIVENRIKQLRAQNIVALCGGSRRKLSR